MPYIQHYHDLFNAYLSWTEH